MAKCDKECNSCGRVFKDTARRNCLACPGGSLYKVKPKPPAFAEIRKGDGYKCELQLQGDEYYRAAGSWRVRYKQRGEKFFTVSQTHPQLNGLELHPITEAAWREGNAGYV